MNDHPLDVDPPEWGSLPDPRPGCLRVFLGLVAFCAVLAALLLMADVRTHRQVIRCADLPTAEGCAP